LEGLFKAWVKHDPIGIQKEIRGLFKNGYSGLQLLQKIQEEVVGGVLLPKEEKGPIAVKLGKVEKCIFDGADEELQILNLLLCK
jgi:replication factor C subunit 2/4